MAETSTEPRVESINCIMCGKTFSPGSKPVCGALVNGKPHCKDADLRRELAQRLVQKGGA